MTTYTPPYQGTAAQPAPHFVHNYELASFGTPPPLNSNPINASDAGHDMDPAPHLHFNPDDFDDLLSIHSLDLQSYPNRVPLSQSMNFSDNGSVGHGSIPMMLPQQLNTNTEFPQKLKIAVDVDTQQTQQTPPPLKAVNAKKKICAQTSIHPQHNHTQTPPVAVGGAMANSGSQGPSVPDEEDFYGDGDGDDDPLFGIPAPDLDTTTATQNDRIDNSAFYASHSPRMQQQQQQATPVKQYGYQAHSGRAYPDYAAPTPREWEFRWDTSPRNPQSTRTPSAAGPRITDPMLIQNALQSVAYYADKLDSLHAEYRRCYGEQQHLSQSLSALHAESQMQAVSPGDYQRQMQSIQASYFSMSQTLQQLIIGICEQFSKMQDHLEHRYQLQLDAHARSQFEKFQRYYEQFAHSQQHLLSFGQQQLQQQQQQQQQQHVQQQQQQNVFNNQQQQQQYHVPPTPQGYRNRVSTAYATNAHKHSGQEHELQAHLPGINCMTPRQATPGNQSYQFAKHGYGGGAHHITNYAKTTTALPDKRFVWGNKHANSQQQPQPQPQQQQQQQRGGGGKMSKSSAQMQHAQTPRASHGSRGANGPKTSADITNVGYVYIGSRMSQLISHIGLSDRDVRAHQQRIQHALHDTLSLDKKNMFAGFDIVAYGSAAHKLFIKGYSDFDFCIRCPKLSVSHREAIEFLVRALRKRGHEFDRVEMIQDLSRSVHGDYLHDVEHIRLFDKHSKRSVDLVLNNLPEIGSSRFISAYDSIDPRFALLCRVVKYWAQQRRISDALHGSLSTYALVLMVINFLQSRRVLPTLAIMIFDPKTGLSPWSTKDDYQINVQKYKDFASKNEEPHSRLLVNFFYFYGHKFDCTTDVVSVRTGTSLLKSDKKWSVDGPHYLCVENPFNSKMNLTANVDLANMKRIANEFRRAYSILCESFKIYEVCKLAD